jgi:hypothetical protein
MRGVCIVHLKPIYDYQSTKRVGACGWVPSAESGRQESVNVRIRDQLLQLEPLTYPVKSFVKRRGLQADHEKGRRLESGSVSVQDRKVYTNAAKEIAAEARKESLPPRRPPMAGPSTIPVGGVASEWVEWRVGG